MRHHKRPPLGLKVYGYSSMPLSHFCKGKQEFGHEVSRSLIHVHVSENIFPYQPLETDARVVNRIFEAWCSQWANGVKMTSYRRRCDVITSHRRNTTFFSDSEAVLNKTKFIPVHFVWFHFSETNRRFVKKQKLSL